MQEWTDGCVDLKNQIKKNKNASWKTQIHVREKRG